MKNKLLALLFLLPSIALGSSALNFTNLGVTSSGGSTNNPYALDNVGIDTSVGSSALTIRLKQKDGSTDPATGSGQVCASFRSDTLASGSFTKVCAQAALSLVISSGSTLGATSGFNDYHCVYLINNAGTMELAASSDCGKDEGLRYSTTAEGGAGAADSFTGLYSTTARTNVAIRLFAVLDSNQSTAGTWATAISRETIVNIKNFQDPYAARWIPFTPTWAGLGTVTNNNMFWKRTGRDTIRIAGQVTSGTVTGSTLTMGFPKGMSAGDSGYYPVTTQWAGASVNGAGNSYGWQPLIQASASVLNFGINGAGVTSLTLRPGSDFGNNSPFPVFTTDIAMSGLGQ